MDALVSVLVPIYDPGPVIHTCFESIRKQTYRNVEVIPVDDAGPEPIRGILSQYAAVDPRWKPIYHEANQGLAASLNDAFRKSAGDYLLILEQDCELVHPDAVERAVAIARLHPRWCLSGSWRFPYSEMRSTEVAFASIRNHFSTASSADLQRRAFTELKCDLIPREALIAAKGFDEHLRVSGEDQVLSFRLRQLGWEIVTTKSLEVTIRYGKQRNFRSNLKKAFVYGFSQAAVLRGGVPDLVAMNIRVSQGRERLVNRLLAVASGFCIGALIPLAILAMVGVVPVILVLVVAALPIIRSALVMSRVLALREKLKHRWPLALLTFALCPLDDVVYTAALGLGTMTRRPKLPKDS